MFFNIYNKYLHYIHSDISFIYHRSQISTIATNDISIGTLLMLEEGLIGTSNQIVKKMKNNEELNNLLYPRDNIDNLMEKYNHNAFEWDKKTYALFYTISRLNHSCDPNLCVSEVKIQKKDCFALFAIKDIKANEELCISYGWDIGHVNSKIFNWKCDCNLTDKERKIIFNKGQALTDQFLKAEFHYLDFLIDSYKDHEINL
jgi:hypothetical protein